MADQHLPGTADAGIRIEADDFDLLGPSFFLLDEPPGNNKFFCPGDPFGRLDVVVKVFGKGLGKIEVLAVFRGDPDIAWRVVNDQRRSLHQPPIDSDLGKDQADCKDYPGERQQGTRLVVKQNLQGDLKHSLIATKPKNI